MLTIKAKIEPKNGTGELFARIVHEQKWLWNVLLRVALHNHSETWYEWAKRQSFEREDGTKVLIDLEGIQKIALQFDRRSAWVSASCPIASGGPRWAKSGGKKTVPYRIGGKVNWIFDENGCKKIDPKNPITGGEIRYKHAYTATGSPKGWAPFGDIEWTPPREWTPFKQIDWTPIMIGEKALLKSADLDSMKRLNSLRRSSTKLNNPGRQPLPDLTQGTSDWVSGTIQNFEAAWDAYLDTKQPDRHKPRWRDLDSYDQKAIPLGTLNCEKPPSKITPKEIVFSTGLTFKIADKSFAKRMGDLIPRPSKVTHKASGWYACLSMATESESLRPTADKNRVKIASRLKKESAELGLSKQDAIAHRDADPDYQQAVTNLAQLDEQIAKERLESSSVKPSANRRANGPIAGIDMGLVPSVLRLDTGTDLDKNSRQRSLRIDGQIKALQIKLDGLHKNDSRSRASLRQKIRRLKDRADRLRGGAIEFEGCVSRLRVQAHIQELQRELSIKRLSNDKRLSLKWYERPPTKNEERLALLIARKHEQAANSSRAWTHKVATRVARTYAAGIAIEEVSPKSIAARPDPLLHESGTRWMPNGATRKTELTYRLNASSWGGVKSEIKQRCSTAQIPFIETKPDSLTCHACGQKGHKPKASPIHFVCDNPECKLYARWQKSSENSAKLYKSQMAKKLGRD